ncbi:MAG: GYD domain-containing protein [Candidatus Dormibacteria bacterium]
MARYVGLFNWTDQGVRNDKQTTARGEAFASLLKSLGAQLIDLHWTLGPYDIVAVMEAPDDETMTAAMLKLGEGGNVRSTTMRAFTSEEVDKIIAKVS